MDESYVCQRIKRALNKCKVGVYMKHNGLTTIGCPDISVTTPDGDWWLEIKLIKEHVLIKSLARRLNSEQAQQRAIAIRLNRTSGRCRYVIARIEGNKVGQLIIVKPENMNDQLEEIPVSIIFTSKHPFKELAIAIKEKNL